MGAQATLLTGCSVHHPRTGAPEAVPPPQRRWPAAPGARTARAHPPRWLQRLAPLLHEALRLFLVGTPCHETAKQEAIGTVRRVLPRLLAPGRPIGNGERAGAGYNSPHATPHHCQEQAVAWRGVAWRGVRRATALFCQSSQVVGRAC